MNTGLWSDDDLSKFLNLSKSKIRQDRMNGRLPFPFIRFGRTIRYVPEQVQAAIQALAK